MENWFFTNISFQGLRVVNINQKEEVENIPTYNEGPRISSFLEFPSPLFFAWQASAWLAF